MPSSDLRSVFFLILTASMSFFPVCFCVENAPNSKFPSCVNGLSEALTFSSSYGAFGLCVRRALHALELYRALLLRVLLLSASRISNSLTANSYKMWRRQVKCRSVAGHLDCLDLVKLETLCKAIFN